MDANTKPRTAPTASPGDRLPRPVVSRLPLRRRSHEDIIADAKKRFADALAYLATR